MLWRGSFQCGWGTDATTFSRIASLHPTITNTKDLQIALTPLLHFPCAEVGARSRKPSARDGSISHNSKSRVPTGKPSTKENFKTNEPGRPSRPFPRTAIDGLPQSWPFGRNWPFQIINPWNFPQGLTHTMPYHSSDR